MNKSDSERIAHVLEKMGYKPEDDKNQADLIVINMCSVRQSPVDRAYGKVDKFKVQSSKCKVALTGCILEQDKKKLKGKVDLIFNIKDLPKLPEKVLAIGQWSNRTIKQSNNIAIKQYSNKTHRYNDYLQTPAKYQSKFSAYVPIMTGCNNFCSYCVVPYLRGPEYSRPAEEIIDEIKFLVKRGCKEIILLGQNVNSYKSRDINFPKLLKMVDNIPGNFWIRFLTSHPKDFSHELIETISECNKVCEYIHLPIQSGDNEVLRRMNRNYTVEHYLRLIRKIREKIRDVAISTDIIVGFPGETKKQFENTAKLFREIKFDMAYIAQYSPRTQTAAFKLKDNVPREEKKRREKVLTKILEKTGLENNRKYIGKIVEVLVNNIKGKKPNSSDSAGQVDSRYILTGKTRTFKNVRFFLNSNLVGQFAKVKITNATPWGLRGKLVEKEKATSKKILLSRLKILLSCLKI